jgi:hypothetical protein
MANCTECSFGLSNTGLPAGCVPILKAARYGILVPTYDSTGARNGIPSSQEINAAYVQARIDDTDSSKRWYPIGVPFANFTAPKSEAVYEESDFQDKFFIRQGVRTANLELWNSNPQHAGALDSAVCTSISIFLFDKDMKMIGSVLSADASVYYPIRIADQSFSSTWNFAEASTTPKTIVQFDFHQAEEDANLRVLETADDLDISSLRGLLDVYATYSGISVNGVTVDLYTNYGTAQNKGAVSGLLLGDFAINELSPTPGSVAITSVTESSTVSGRYAIVFTAPATIADVHELVITKTKYDFTAVRSNTYTIV